MTHANQTKIRTAVLGASGYTGAELLRLLLRHPYVEIVLLTADRRAGHEMRNVFPQFSPYHLPKLQSLEGIDWKALSLDLAFCALPHGTTQKVIKALLEAAPRTRVVDLSADFRLSDVAAYARWYGHAHHAPELQKEAVYGLVERYRDEIVIDAKSGMTGAGRGPKEEMLFAEVAEGIHAYGVGQHRHMAELDQEFSRAAGRDVVVTFTPHLMPINRGILSTIYVRSRDASPPQLHAVLAKAYAGEPFVHVLPFGEMPQTRHVRGSNLTFIGVAADRIAGRAIVGSALDNLTKGASGQAVQNMNLMFGFPETLGIDQVALFP